MYQRYIAQILDLFMLFDDISSFLPPQQKQIGSNGKNHHALEESSCWPDKFQVGSFYLQHLYLGLDGWWGCKAGERALQQPTKLELLSWQQLLSLKRVTCRYAAPQSADHSIEILSQVNEWTCFVGKESVWSFWTKYPINQIEADKEHVQAEMNLRNRALLQFPMAKGTCQKEIGAMYFWGKVMETPMRLRVKKESKPERSSPRGSPGCHQSCCWKHLQSPERSLPEGAMTMGGRLEQLVSCGCFGWEEERMIWKVEKPSEVSWMI